MPANQYDDWVFSALGFTIPDTLGEQWDLLQLEERLEEARGQISQLVRANDPAARDIAALLLAATKAVQAKGNDAPAKMDSLEAALARALSEARGRQAQGQTRISVDFRKLLIEWHAAQNEAQTNLGAIGAAYLDDEEVQQDPRFDQVQEVVRDLPTLIPSFGNELDSDINAILSDGGKSPELLKKGLTTVGKYRKTLEGASELDALERTAKKDLGGDFRVFSALAAAIESIESQLQTIA